MVAGGFVPGQGPIHRLQGIAQAQVGGVQTVLLAAGQKQAGHGARSVAEFLRQGKQIILWRHNAVRENCLIFMPAAELGQFGLDFRHRGKTGAPGVLLRRSKSAFHSTVSAHRKPHDISALRYGLNAEKPTAERWQFLIDVGEILGAAGHIGIKASLHFGNDQNSPVGAGQVFGLGIAQPAGAVVSQAMQQVHHWRGGQISGIRHGNKHRCCHAERFRHDVTAEKCHGLPLL